VAGRSRLDLSRRSFTKALLGLAGAVLGSTFLPSALKARIVWADTSVTVIPNPIPFGSPCCERYIGTLDCADCCSNCYPLCLSNVDSSVDGTFPNVDVCTKVPTGSGTISC
jgi:hypothetical protein